MAYLIALNPDYLRLEAVEYYKDNNKLLNIILDLIYGIIKTFYK